MGKTIWIALSILFFVIILIEGFLLFSQDLTIDKAQVTTLNENNALSSNPSIENLDKKGGILRFSSFDEFKKFLGSDSKSTQYGSVKSGGELLAGVYADLSGTASIDNSGLGETTSAESYSQTNVQIEGVDEPDIIKNDGKYIYTLSGNTIKIINAFPVDDMELLSEIKYENKVLDYDKPYSKDYVRNIFINDDKLIVFVNSYDYIPYSAIRCLGLYYCGGESDRKSLIHVYDISDKKNPELEQDISIKGEYYNARMIKDYIYLISRDYLNPDEPELPVYYINGLEKTIPIEDIYYFNYYDDSYYMTSLSSLNLKGGDFLTKSYVIGYSSVIYASEDNIYVTNNEYMENDEYQKKLITDAVIPIVPESEQEEIKELLDSERYEYSKWRKIGKIVEDYYNGLSESEQIVFNQTLFDNLFDSKVKLEKERQKTIVNKFSVDRGEIEYKATGKVPGRILDQFSMDESGGYFRIATTVGNRWWWGWRNSVREVNSSNGVYVLDSDLDIVGKVEDLASGDTIRSTRFVEGRLYMVTYRRVDPFFVIDLSNPNNPEVLGYLEIPGASEYLHPYDENNIIGIGYNEDGVRKGMKISLFDVSDPLNPEEKANYLIGDRGTRSPVLSDHKALLFDKSNNLMVFPVIVYEIDPNKYGNDVPEWTRGDAVFQGAYVFNIDANGIELRGKITHFEPYVPVFPSASEEHIGEVRYDRYGNSYTKVGNDKWKTNYHFHGYYLSDLKIDEFPGGQNFHPNFYDSRYTVKRSLFMDNSLYTVSNSMVRANDLNTLEPQKSVDLRYLDSYNPHNYY
jgi:uncharacterized secreted protein with C-terminal beta-propeller domain